MNRLNDPELVLRAQDGDTAAFEELVKRHLKGVRIEAAGILGDRFDEEDVAQEAFLRAFQKLSSLGPPFCFGSWIRQIARNIARNTVSRTPRIVPLEQAHIIKCSTVPEENNHTEQASLIVRAISKLSSPLRETTRLAYLSRNSHQQVADKLCIPIGTVKSRLWKSRSMIRKDVIRMNHKGRNPSSAGIIPAITILELPEETMKIRSEGPGLYFGSILREGHTEVCKFFDYPGGVLTQTVHTHVLREIEILGRKCMEVIIEHSDCEPIEPNVLDYFEPLESGYRWIMRTVADGSCPQTRFMNEDDELFPLKYSTGEHDSYVARAVKLSIGDKQYGECLAVFWGWEGGTPAESFFSKNGRQVLHRRYVGPDAPVSSSYEYSNLDGEYCRTFRSIEYHLWYDTVLIEP